MAMENYFYQCYKMKMETTPDGLGGYNTVYTAEKEFKGLVIKNNSTEQLIGALRGAENVSYRFHTYTDVELEKDDIISYKENGIVKYIRLTSSEQINTERSPQIYWKTFQAEKYTPILGEQC